MKLLYVLQSQKMTNYKSFIREIANRRLMSIDYFANNGLTDIQVLLGTKENLDEEARALTKNNSKRHFEILKKRVSPSEYTQIMVQKKNVQRPRVDVIDLYKIIIILVSVSKPITE